MQTAGRIQNHDVVAVILGVGIGLFGDDLRLLGAQAEHRNPGLCTHDLQLVNGGGAIDIAGHQQRAVPLLEEILGQLGRMGGFTVALKAAHHQHGGTLALDVDVGRLLAAHQIRQLFVDDLHHLLGRGQAFHNLLAHGALAYLIAEILCDLEVYVRLQQSHPHLAHGGLNVRLAELAFAAQPLKNAIQTIGKRFKCHAFFPFHSLMVLMMSSISRASRSILFETA